MRLKIINLQLNITDALEKMDIALAADDAFNLFSSDDNEMKITACVDVFITLLQTITERYESLPQPGHRLQFLDLQLELLDDFRIRLLQLHHNEINDPVESRLPQIANTVYYVEYVLLDWGTTVVRINVLERLRFIIIIIIIRYNLKHYLHLYHYKNQFEEVDSEKIRKENPVTPDPDMLYGTVFDDTMSLYKHMRIDLVNTICESVLHDVVARSRPYRKDR